MKGPNMPGRYFNEEGEPLMTAAQARFEAYLDDEPDVDAYYDRFED
ncbi:hypothetical protein SEA_ENCELADUS_114 [Mycobacterium phage Enceladus]|nr:hypothetical protein SEA_ENCELADUS_114 [Mycobacterium phage Enceladus]